MRNNTNFQAELTSMLRDAYYEHRELSESDSRTPKARLAATLKYYQYLVHSYIGWLDTQGSDPEGSRGLLVYHKMGLGKTFDAVAVSLTACGALHIGQQMRKRRVLLIAAKSLHGNFEKSLTRFLDIYMEGADEKERARRPDIEELARRSVTYITMNAHNMADQVAAATRLASTTGDRKEETAGALDGMLVVVDEAHDLFQALINSAAETTNARRLFSMIMSARNVRLMFMTGTPSAKHPFELVPCFNMLAGKELLPTQYDVFMKHFVDKENFKLKNENKLANRIVGMVSHVGYESAGKEKLDISALASVTVATGGGAFSFPEALPIKIEECEMSEQQYRQYLLARDKESSEGGKKGRGGGKAPTDRPRIDSRPSPPMALPGSERKGGSTYYVHSRMLGNYAAIRDHMPTADVLASNAVLGIDVTLSPEDGGDLPDEAFTKESSPKIAKLIENIADSPGPALVYSQFVGIGGLAVVERFLKIAGYSRWTSSGSVTVKKRRPVRGKKRGGADEELCPKLPEYNDSEWKIITEVAQKTHEFSDEDLGVEQFGKFTSGALLPYRQLPETAAHVYTNLHLGQRKLFLSELHMLNKAIEKFDLTRDSEMTIIYAGAAAGYHIPYLASLFPNIKFHLYDPAAFCREVNGHPNIKTYREFFTDEVAKSWGEGGSNREKHGTPDFFISDIRVNASTRDEFEYNVSVDMDNQSTWTKLLRPSKYALLKFRLPYVTPESEQFVEYLDGETFWQCWPPRMSTEMRLLVDCSVSGSQLPTKKYDTKKYESAAFTHNAIVRPFVRFGDRDDIKRHVNGYDGSWDCRAEVAVWEKYVGDGDIEAISKHMNELSHAVRQTLVGQPSMRSGSLAGRDSDITGCGVANRVSEINSEINTNKHKMGIASAASRTSHIPASLEYALRVFPAHGKWREGIAQTSQTPQNFTELHSVVGETDNRPFSLPVPALEFLSKITLERPKRSNLIAIVQFLNEYVSRNKRFPEQCKLHSDTSTNVTHMVKLLFPTTEVICGSDYTAQCGDLILEARELPSGGHEIGKPPAGEVALWACWGPYDHPGTNYVIRTLNIKNQLKTPEESKLKRVATHQVYDRAWSRYKTPASKSLGDQKLDAVIGYDNGWDCTFETHTWIRYLRNCKAHNIQPPSKYTGELINMASDELNEPLKENVSAHGRLASQTALDAVNSLISVIKQHKQKLIRGGSDTPDELKYAVISGEVSPEEREAVRAAFNSPENIHGGVIRVLLMSKTGAQGVDLRHGRQVHILEPYWYKTLENQVIARFIRIGALDALPPEERTVQPFLYLATPNKRIINSLPEEALEVPVSTTAEGGGTLPPGTTVDVAFHHRALNNEKLGDNARELLRKVSIERALYGDCGPEGGDASKCRICRPTNAPMFHEFIEDDMKLPDPCDVLTEEQVQTKSVQYNDVEYQYREDPNASLGYRFYQKSSDGSANSGTYYSEILESTSLYYELVEFLQGGDFVSSLLNDLTS